jgi:hypothetical protein
MGVTAICWGATAFSSGTSPFVWGATANSFGTKEKVALGFQFINKKYYFASIN